MQEANIILKGEETTQMKALALLIQKASGYRSSIHVQSGNKRANAKSLLGLMSLGLVSGDELSIIAEGEDEEAAVKELSSWLENPNLEQN